MGMKHSKITSSSLIEHLSIIPDFRCHNKRHLLIDILMISVCAMLCGAKSFWDMEEFGKAKEEWFSEFLKLPGGIPSHDTFGRVFALLDSQVFAQCFMNWTQSVRKSIPREVIAIDGKTIRRSFDSYKGSKAIHMVNAWATENGLALGQVKTDEKSNEITAIPQLLRSLELEGCIVTLDAMGCQKSIAKEIHEAGADYVLSLKGNHEIVHQEVQSFLEDALNKKFKGVSYDFLETVEKGHGRIETRRYWITQKIEWFADREKWEALGSVGMVESVRQIGEKTTIEKRFYLTSLKADAQEFARAVRGHWNVENQLHWVLDVCFAEDQCRARIHHAAQNFAILRQIALNTLKRDSTNKRGIQGKQKSAGWNNNYLALLLKNLYA